MKKVVSLIVVLLCVVGLVACSKKSAVIGAWTDMDGYNTMEFNEKTGRMISGSQEVGFNYTIDDKTISADLGYMVDVMDYSLSKVNGVDCLKLKVNGENFTFYRKDDIAKIKTNTQTTEETIKMNNAKKNDKTLIGKWKDVDDTQEVFEFIDEKNGKYTITEADYIMDFTYEFDDKNIYFNFMNMSQKTWKYRINNEKTKLYIEYDGKEHTYIKQ